MKITPELIKESKLYNHTKLMIEGGGRVKNLVIRNVFTNAMHPFPGLGLSIIQIPPSQLVQVREWINS